MTKAETRPASRAAAKAGTVRVGIGGWTYAPWRGVFYPKGLPHAKELAHASRRLTSIEINGTFYRTQKPATYAGWAREVPDGFVFSLKGPRAATWRRVLAEAKPSIERFLQSGPLELGDRLGPMLWQLAPTKKFDAADLGRFLELLPHEMDGRRLRHALEVRHPSFASAEVVALARRFGVAIVCAEHATYPQIADPTADFVYARLQNGRDKLKTGYPAAAIEAWGRRLAVWASGGAPSDLAYVDEENAPKSRARDVFAYVIHEGKLRAPAAAEALIAKIPAAPK